VHERLTVNGETRAASEYAEDVARVGAAFPDYRWTLQHAVVEPPWLSVHLTDRGTHQGPWLGRPGTGRTVTTDEFAMYRIVDGRIAEIWSAADNARLVDP
jgi:predicted ester cyclase